MALEGVLIYLWETLKLWLFTIFAAPIKNLNMLWILVPVYLTWFFAEFFQEKHGTSMGNAVTNAVVVFWGGFDWMRNTITKITQNQLALGLASISRMILAVSLVVYGVLIIVLGLKGNKLIKVLGRIREVTYLVIIFTPVFYEVVPLSWRLVLAAVLFFPLYYFAIELLDKYMPNPKAVVQDIQDAGGKAEKTGVSTDDFSSSSTGGDDFGSSSSGTDDFGDFGKGDDFKL